MKIIVFIIYGCVISCKNEIMYILLWWAVYAITQLLFWCLFPSLRNSGNKHQNNPLVNAYTVCHLSTYIILHNFMDDTLGVDSLPSRQLCLVTFLPHTDKIKFEEFCCHFNKLLCVVQTVFLNEMNHYKLDLRNLHLYSEMKISMISNLENQHIDKAVFVEFTAYISSWWKHLILKPIKINLSRWGLLHVGE